MDINTLPDLQRNQVAVERVRLAFHGAAFLYLADVGLAANWKVCEMLLMGRIPQTTLMNAMLSKNTIWAIDTFEQVDQSTLSDRAWEIIPILALVIKG